MSERISRFRVIHKKNGGVSSARNMALDAATGDWIVFVDADDVVRFTWLQEIAEAVSETSANALVAFAKVEFYDVVNWTDDIGVVRYDLRHEVHSAMAWLALYQFAYPHDLIRDLRFQPYTVGEDLLFVSEALAQADAVVFLRRSIYAYRHRCGSAIHSAQSARKIQDRIHYIPAILNVLVRSGKRLDRIFSHTLVNSWIESIPALILSGFNGAERLELLGEWRGSLCQAEDFPCLSYMNRLRALINFRFSSEMIMRITCVWPYQLKKMIRRII